MKSLDEAVAKFKFLKEKLKQISEQPSNQTPKFSKQNKENQANMQNTINQLTRISKTKPILNKKQPQPEQTQVIKMIGKSSQKSYRKQKQEKQKDDAALSLVLKNKKSINRYENDNEFVLSIGNSKEKQPVNHKINKKNGLLLASLDEKNDSKIQTQKKGQHRKNNSWNCQASLGTDNSYEMRALTSLNSSRVDEFGKQLKQKQRTLEQINQLLERKKQVLQALQRKIGTGFLEDGRLDTTIIKGKRGIRAPNLFQMQAQARKRSKSKTMTIRWK